MLLVEVIFGAGYTAIKVSNLSIIDFPLTEGESYMNTVEMSANAQEKLSETQSNYGKVFLTDMCDRMLVDNVWAIRKWENSTILLFWKISQN